MTKDQLSDALLSPDVTVATASVTRLLAFGYRHGMLRRQKQPKGRKWPRRKVAA